MCSVHTKITFVFIIEIICSRIFIRSKIILFDFWVCFSDTFVDFRQSICSGYTCFWSSHGKFWSNWIKLCWNGTNLMENKMRTERIWLSLTLPCQFLWQTKYLSTLYIYRTKKDYLFSSTAFFSLWILPN